MNFPADGPVMMKKTEKLEQSSETMYARAGVLVGDVNRTLLLKVHLTSKNFFRLNESTYCLN